MQLVKIKQLIKKFLKTASQEGLLIALSRTVRKVWKKTKGVMVGRNVSSSTLEIIEESQLDNYHPLKVPFSSSPVISIIIPVYNNCIYTFNCLKSISENFSLDIPLEIIVVDDASTDETPKVLTQVSGVIALRNENNSGFIKSCNYGASQAQGKYLYFLNNDTQILDGCLENLLATIEKDNSIGAVGSKLIYPDGRLQEAGGIIWRDASGWNYGRLDSPDEPEYNYVKEADYCSGASLLVRTNLFEQLGGFSEELLPAYYEDTDLCFAIRHLGYKVVYQPKSRVIHYEGITSGTSITSGIKQYQEVNRTKFQLKWQEQLKQHFENDPDRVPAAARRLRGKSTILIIDSYVPLYDKESGSYRLLSILKILLNLGYCVIFLPDNGFPEQPYTSELQDMGIEVVYGTPQEPDMTKRLLQILTIIDCIWLCRPELCEKYLELIRGYSQAPIIYDTIDLHFLRLKRQKEFLPNLLQNNQSWQDYQKLELKFAQLANATVVVTEFEKETLESLGIGDIAVIPNIHHCFDGLLKPFDERTNLLFIGGYNHPPNVDAVVWLCQEIMPLIWQVYPEIKLTLLGSNPPETVQSLANERVTVTGYVKDVEPYFLNSRVFVAPLRFGAGMKGKIGHSMSYGLPAVTTAIGAEGIGLTDGYDVLIAEEAQTFADRVIKLYGDSQLWNSLSGNMLKTIRQYSPANVQSKLQQLLASLSIHASAKSIE